MDDSCIECGCYILGYTAISSLIGGLCWPRPSGEPAHRCALSVLGLFRVCS